MPSRDFSVDFTELTKFNQDIGKVAKIAGEEFHKAMTKAVAVLEGQIVGRVPVSSGFLRQSIGRGVDVEGGDIVGSVSAVASYGAAVEYGRRPGKWPPRDAIEFWVRRELGLDGREAEQAAFLIARAIGTRGTQRKRPNSRVPAYMFRDGFAAAEPAILKLFDSATEEIITRLQNE